MECGDLWCGVVWCGVVWYNVERVFVSEGVYVCTCVYMIYMCVYICVYVCVCVCARVCVYHNT